MDALLANLIDTSLNSAIGSLEVTRIQFNQEMSFNQGGTNYNVSLGSTAPIFLFVEGRTAGFGTIIDTRIKPFDDANIFNGSGVFSHRLVARWNGGTSIELISSNSDSNTSGKIYLSFYAFL